MPFCLLNISNFADTSCGPLLLTIISGKPHLAKIVRNSSTVRAIDVNIISTTSSCFKYVSTTINHIEFKNMPAKSMCNLLPRFFRIFPMIHGYFLWLITNFNTCVTTACCQFNDLVCLKTKLDYESSLS